MCGEDGWMGCVGSGGKGPGMSQSFLIISFYSLLVLFRGSYPELCTQRTDEAGDFLSVCKVWRGPSVLSLLLFM